MDNQSNPSEKNEQENNPNTVDVISRPSLMDTTPTPPRPNPQGPGAGVPSSPNPALSANSGGGSVSVSSGGRKKSKAMSMALSLLVILIFVAAVLGVYEWQHKKITTLDAQVASLQSSVNSLNSKLNSKTTVTISTSPSSTSALTVFKIPELGVELSVPATLADLTYAVNTGHTVSNLSTQTLTDLDAGCTANATTGLALGNISKTSGKFTATTGVTLVKQYPTYYISYTAAPSACSKVAQVSALTTTLATDLKSSFSTIQQTSN